MIVIALLAVLAGASGPTWIGRCAVFGIGLDDADIFVDCAAGKADFYGSNLHAIDYHDRIRCNQGIIWELCDELGSDCHYAFLAEGGRSHAQILENKAFPHWCSGLSSDLTPILA